MPEPPDGDSGRNGETWVAVSSEVPLADAFWLAPVMMHAICEDGILRYVNKYWLEKTGYSKDEVLGRHIDFIMTDESAQRALTEVIPRFWKEGRVRDVPYQYIRKDGSIMDVMLNCERTYDEEGQPISLSVVHDVTELKQTRRALRESEYNYRILAETSWDMISRHDAAGVYLYVSPACRRLLGYEPEELLGRDAYQFYHPEDIPDVSESHQRILERQVGYTVTYRIRRKDRRYVWVETNSYSTIDPGTGAVQEIIATTRDISRWKEAQDELRRSEQKFQLVFANNPDPAAVVRHRDQRLLEANAAFVRLTHVSPEATADAAFEGLGDWLRSDSWSRIMYRLQSEGDTITDEVHVPDHEGNESSYLLSATLVTINHESCVLLMIKDVTALHQSRRKLQQRTDELMSLADNAPDLIYRMDRSLRHTFVNQRLVEITGIPRNEYEGKTNRELGMPADHCDTWDEIQSQVFRTGRPVEHEFSYDTIRGPRLYHARIVPEFNDAGEVETILGIVRDITEYEDARLRLQQAYDQLRRNREDLEAKNRAMREVLDKIEEDRQRVRQNIATNVELSIAPTLERLRHQVDPSLVPQLNLVEEQLTDLASSFYSRLQARFTRLSPRELEICQMIRHGMSSKEIAGSLNVSLLTIHKHREQIRSKLGLTGKPINLSSYLQNF